MLKIASIVGARPQFIKIAPLIHTIQNYNNIDHLIIHTGQHYDYEMSQVFFEELELKTPNYHLGVGSENHGYQTGEMLKRIEEILISEKPHVVIVYGDTNSTLAGALAAVKLHIPVAHIEAGLRSFNKKMPEEINRILTDHCSDILFCPTKNAVNNLYKEGFTNIINNGELINETFINNYSLSINHLPIVINVGDIMYESVLLYFKLAEKKSNILKKLGLINKKYYLITLHRAENTENTFRFKNIWEALNIIAQMGTKIIFPIHPRTSKLINSLHLKAHSNLILIKPVSYLDMLMLEANAQKILTDSGGVQKEAFFFKIPCITLREETEWIETITSGWNILVGADIQKIIKAANSFYGCFNKSLHFYGDAQTSKKIIYILLKFKGLLSKNFAIQLLTK
ncbi:MAG: UDP-N-acetylglucosamine 2-epimerase (non-hydrolyzing) [Candidatus Desulfofervidus auxilii]|nr:UDP-N-acetylglucosamine 2-epimerase (non-hydrolyzing) [Candidatus Desulfofervidus auxilii]